MAFFFRLSDNIKDSKQNWLSPNKIPKMATHWERSQDRILLSPS